jgi:hypothetical protein
MRRAVLAVAAVLACTGCGTHSSLLSAQNVRTAFAAHHFPLKTEGYFKFGPAQRVLYLWWASQGGIHRTRNGFKLVEAKSFYILIFRSPEVAAAALRAPRVAHYFRVGHIPFAPPTGGDGRRFYRLSATDAASLRRDGLSEFGECRDQHSPVGRVVRRGRRLDVRQIFERQKYVRYAQRGTCADVLASLSVPDRDRCPLGAVAVEINSETHVVDDSFKPARGEAVVRNDPLWLLSGDVRQDAEAGRPEHPCDPRRAKRGGRRGGVRVRSSTTAPGDEERTSSQREGRYLGRRSDAQVCPARPRGCQPSSDLGMSRVATQP